jgi:hypothetical protein
MSSYFRDDDYLLRERPSCRRMKRIWNSIANLFCNQRAFAVELALGAAPREARNGDRLAKHSQLFMAARIVGKLCENYLVNHQLTAAGGASPSGGRPPSPPPPRAA